VFCARGFAAKEACGYAEKASTPTIFPGGQIRLSIAQTGLNSARMKRAERPYKAASCGVNLR
jgi:hypothetical protein